MSYILKIVKPSDLQNWIAANASGSLKATARESWRAYLIAQGATGSTLRDLESSYLSAQPGGTLHDKWSAFNTAQGGNTGKEKARNKYR